MAKHKVNDTYKGITISTKSVADILYSKVLGEMQQLDPNAPTADDDHTVLQPEIKDLLPATVTSETIQPPRAHLAGDCQMLPSSATIPSTSTRQFGVYETVGTGHETVNGQDQRPS